MREHDDVRDRPDGHDDENGRYVIGLTSRRKYSHPRGNKEAWILRFMGLSD